MLIARGADAEQTAAELPLVQRAAPARGDARAPAWISEALQDLYGLKLGATLSLPLADQLRPFRVAGVWRDYARTFGAVVISRTDYVAATGDRGATEGPHG